jgi:2-oxoglutarate ferredoxin oxidoreductase subunit alpha
MGKKLLITGNEAVGYGAIYAGCLNYFGYPITPQNEIVEFFARELPKRGGNFVQTESELTSINMLYGALATGVRAMTSSSSTGFSLMQECIAHMAYCSMPAVIVNVQRGGPGAGSTQTAQMDYAQVTKGGGNGDYYSIVLAPFSVTEIFELVQRAFYLADKYRNPVIVLSDAILGQMMENMELYTINFGPLPPKDWAATGQGERKYRNTVPNIYAFFNNYRNIITNLGEKYQEISKNEVRYKTYELEDAELVIVSYGSSARIALETLRRLRPEGYRVGLIRPITLWPFPTAIIREVANRVKNFLVVEDSLGQLIEDVEFAVAGKAEVHLLGSLSRHLPTSSGMIFPKVVSEEVKHILCPK